MTLEEYTNQIPGFANKAHPEKIKLLGWYLHTHKSQQRFTLEAVRDCYKQLNYEPPNLSRDFARLVGKSPKELLRDGLGYRLEARVKSKLDAALGNAISTIAVTKLLNDLPAKIPGIEERVFLNEAIICFRAKAYRAAIVMGWNLAFDHILNWIICDPLRLGQFNTGLTKRFPKKGFLISKYVDFEDLKEYETIEVLNSSGLVSGALIKVLNKELPRRNSAAHPSDVEITQHQAEDALSDLVINVVLKLA